MNEEILTNSNLSQPNRIEEIITNPIIYNVVLQDSFILQLHQVLLQSSKTNFSYRKVLAFNKLREAYINSRRAVRTKQVKKRNYSENQFIIDLNIIESFNFEKLSSETKGKHSFGKLFMLASQFPIVLTLSF